MINCFGQGGTFSKDENWIACFRCYQCGLEQMCWEPFEDPWVRHGFLQPSCSYVERIKGRAWVEAVARGEF